MNALVELIKRIGIFMIAAQAVLHFTPGQKYEKYIKLLVGMIVLLQFVMPLHGILSGVETDWSAKMTDMEKMLATEGVTEETTGSSSVSESVISNLEKEIKSRLNSEISGEDYVVSNVRVSMRVFEESGEIPNGVRQYELEKVRVVVYQGSVLADGREDKEAGNAENAIEKIQIEKIDIGSAAENGGLDMEEAEEMAERLRGRFCAVLGMDEENMEVSVYGTNEKTDR